MDKEQVLLEDLHFLFDKIYSPTADCRLEEWYNLLEQIVKDLDYDFEKAFRALDLMYQIGKYFLESKKIWREKKREGDKK